MNSFPVYVVWDDCLGHWLGGSFSYSCTTNIDRAITLANKARPWAPHHCFHVIESWGEPHYDKEVYQTLPIYHEVLQ